MSEPVVLATYILTYGVILGYAGWLHFRHRRATRSPEA